MKVSRRHKADGGDVENAVRLARQVLKRKKAA
jgi:hypothetical protein